MIKKSGSRIRNLRSGSLSILMVLALLFILAGVALWWFWDDLPWVRPVERYSLEISKKWSLRAHAPRVGGYPKLILTGYGVPSRSSGGFAILNGECVSVGDLVRGVRVVSVEDRGVWLSYHGEKRLLGLDGFLPVVEEGVLAHHDGPLD